MRVLNGSHFDVGVLVNGARLHIGPWKIGIAGFFPTTAKGWPQLGENAAPTTTITSFLLDRTGSMGAIKAETIGGFNAYLDALERDVVDVVEFTPLAIRQRVHRHPLPRGQAGRRAAAGAGYL